MLENLSIVQYIQDNYTSVSKLERLSFIASTSDSNQTTLSACLEIVQFLDQKELFSPDIETICLPKLKELSPAQYENLMETNWSSSLSNRVERKMAQLTKISYVSESEIHNLIELVMIHCAMRNYSIASELLMSTSIGSKTCRLSEIQAQIGILQGNYNLTLAQDKKIESFLSGCFNHEIYADRLTKMEIFHYFRIKLLIIFAEFMRRNYEDVIELFDKLLKITILSHSGVTYTWLDIFNDSDGGKFINKDEIIKIYILSLLITCPVNKLKKITTEDTFIIIVTNSLNYKQMFQSLSQADFKSLFQILETDFKPFINSNPFFKKIWADITLQLRYKAYGLYLSLIVRVNATQLSHKLSTIDKPALIRELKGYIKDKELEFEYDPTTEIFQKIKIDKHYVFLSKLSTASEEIDTIENILKENSTFLKGRIKTRYNQQVDTTTSSNGVGSSDSLASSSNDVNYG